MNKAATTALIFGLALSAAGCGGMHSTATIMQTVSGDPVGSANIGTGSVTVGAVIPDEAKAAGIGFGP
ncbi:MAG TPA: hypothetical protein VM164_13980 [Burkholderiales bacterium]|nr:hypothetical protein [Burkholderiales bacterium]